MGTRFLIPRRTFLGRSLLVAIAAKSRGLWAQGWPLRYGRLSQPVLIPLADMPAAWRARPFVAEATTLPSAAAPNKPIRVSGMIVRTAVEDAAADRFRAVCLRCPHEGCDVDFKPDPERLPAEVLQEIGQPVRQPVYLCPCHNSTFRADDGERMSGPAPRGLYRFRVTAVNDTVVEIGEVEEDVLIFL